MLALAEATARLDEAAGRTEREWAKCRCRRSRRNLSEKRRRGSWRIFISKRSEGRIVGRRPTMRRRNRSSCSETASKLSCACACSCASANDPRVENPYLVAIARQARTVRLTNGRNRMFSGNPVDRSRRYHRRRGCGRARRLRPPGPGPRSCRPAEQSCAAPSPPGNHDKAGVVLSRGASLTAGQAPPKPCDNVADFRQKP